MFSHLVDHGIHLDNIHTRESIIGNNMFDNHHDFTSSLIVIVTL